MNPTTHESNNTRLGPPVNHDATTQPEIATLHVTCGFDEDMRCEKMSSFWQPDVEELIALAKGNKIMLTVFGTGHPVVSLAVLKETDGSALD